MSQWIKKCSRIAISSLLFGTILIVFYPTYTDSYYWPIGSGIDQEWVSGTLGESRPSSPGGGVCYDKWHYHDGMDMRTVSGDRYVWGTQEFPAEYVVYVSSRTVVGTYHDYRHLEEVQVDVDDRLRPNTYIGDYQPSPVNHVHFSDELFNWGNQDCDHEYNPVNGLEGYTDTRQPVVHDIQFIEDERHDRRFGGSPFPVVSGYVDIVARARDEVSPGGFNNGVYAIGYYVDVPPYITRIMFD